MGSEEELRKLPFNEGFQSRLVDCPGLPSMRWLKDAEDWTKFLKDFDQLMVDHDLVRGLTDLGEVARAEALCEITLGIVSRLKWLIGHALRMTVRRDGERIELAELIAAGDALLRKYPRTGAINPLSALR
jgi:hypothetical protein